jgi:hypothetical protein
MSVERVALEDIPTLTRALELCMKGAGIEPKEMAARLGVGYDHFTRMFREHDSRHFPPDLIPRFMEECKSALPLEWLAWQMGYCLHERTLAAILESIRDAMVTAGGEAPRFLLMANGRLEPATGGRFGC